MTSTTHLLREILLEGKARTQSEIQQELERQGVASSQSKISRLLHQIGAVKLIDSQGKTHYRLPHEAGLIHELTSPQEKTLISQWVLDVIANETLIIIHTTPGAAGMVARIIDQHRNNLEILGTIAGDDTIFVAPQNNERIKETIAKITQLFNL
ncbi:MAG: ArgR family transcriptional regulator [Gammaproteobacteria bacterium]|jgi:transcriptional regulator of arginine metabolism|nr:ArgR family transcriptional regulator [Legionellaceae bacterium]MBP9774554.1 ArgR family transcriptional regulator [Legionellaceae bacterium]MCX7119041.1 ArgR family transcriptional regulator [Legionellales bacterium]